MEKKSSRRKMVWVSLIVFPVGSVSLEEADNSAQDTEV